MKTYNNRNTQIMIRLALYQPDIPQNTGTILRLAACFGTQIDIIEPCGFIWSDNNLKKSALEALSKDSCTRHSDWQSFADSCKQNNKRILLLTTKAEQSYTEVKYSQNDILLLGRETAGVPQNVHDACKIRLRIPMQAETRSLNLALSAAIALSEAIRQIGNVNLQ